MKLPRMRFTIQWMMVVVAIVAFALGATLWGLKMRHLARSHRLKAQTHKQRETMNRGFEANWVKRALEVEKLRHEIDELQRLPHDPGEPQFAVIPDERWKRLLTECRERAEHSGRKAAHHASLARKYERAARFPWFAIEPDPPEPE